MTKTRLISHIVKIKTTISLNQFEFFQSLSKKISDPMTSGKSYSSMLHYQISCIPTLHDDKLITTFKGKAEIFNKFFAKQCSLINTNSDLQFFQRKQINYRQ